MTYIHHATDFRQDISPILISKTLDSVVDRFAETGFDRLPVVDSQRHLVGSVIMSDIIRQYNQEVANRNITLELGARIAAHDKSNTLHIGKDNVIAEIEVPKWMIGKDLGKLRLRSRYHVSVFLIKKTHEHEESDFITPNISYVFCKGDNILVSGTEKDIEAMENNI